MTETRLIEHIIYVDFNCEPCSIEWQLFLGIMATFESKDFIVHSWLSSECSDAIAMHSDELQLISAN